jgi:uncharacterized protein
MRTSLNTFRGTMLAAALCFAAVAPMAHADDASRRAKAEEMLKLTNTDSLMATQLSALRDRVNELATQQSGAAAMTPAQKQLTDNYLKQVQGVTDDEVGWTKLRPMVIQAYADTFSEADLDGIIAFYKTPAGQSIVAKTPELSTKTMTMVQDRIKDMQPKLAQMTEDYVNKMKATDAPAGAAKPAGATARPATAGPAAKPAPAAK